MNSPDHTEFWVLDGLEDTPTGRVARLERPDGTTADLDAQLLPEEAREGDVLEVVPGPDGNLLKLAPEVSQQRRAAAQQQLDALNLNQPSSDQHSGQHSGSEEITL